MPKLLPLSQNEDSSVCSHSLCRKLSSISSSISIDSKKCARAPADRLVWGQGPSHLEKFLSNRHQMFREILRPMSPVSFARSNDTMIHKSKASKSPYLKHMKSLRDKELFLLKSGLISDSSGIDDANLKKEIALQNQLQSIVSPISILKPKRKRLIQNKYISSNASVGSLWSDESSLESTSLHADTLSYLVANSSNEWWKNNRATSGDTACSGGSEYGIFEGELVSLNGDDELISNDSDSVHSRTFR